MSDLDDDEVIWVDRDIRDADWLRSMSWDLPTNVDDFLYAIGGRKRLAHFLTLPAAQAMPDDLRAALGV